MKKYAQDVKLEEGRILNIKTQRHAFGKYEGKAQVTRLQLDDIWRYNGYVAVVKLMDEHELDRDLLPIEMADIAAKS